MRSRTGRHLHGWSSRHPQRLHAYSAVDDVDRAAVAGQTLDYAARTHIRAQAGFAAQHVVEAIGTALNVHGKSLLGIDERVSLML
ncbi:hypothetical protein OG216_38375 [Streptomycetaceae bacterium NBC_01309]